MTGLSKEVPEFFTVYLPEFCSHQLKICSSFKAHLGREVTGEAVIKRSTTNQKWKVGLVKEGGEFVFKKGWKEFVEENGMSTGEFMVFQYHGKSRFTVDIFGTNSLKKVSPANQNIMLADENGGDADADADDDGGGGGGGDSDDEGISREQKPMIPWRKRGRTSVSEKGNKAIQKAKKLILALNNPSFMVCITDSYVAMATMHLPSTFMSRYMRETHSSVELQTSENTWSARLLRYHSSRSRKTYYKLGDGFGDFLHDNDIQAGDVCVFEAVHLPGNTLKVTIFGSTIKKT